MDKKNPTTKPPSCFRDELTEFEKGLLEALNTEPRWIRRHILNTRRRELEEIAQKLRTSVAEIVRLVAGRYEATPLPDSSWERETRPVVPLADLPKQSSTKKPTKKQRRFAEAEKLKSDGHNWPQIVELLSPEIVDKAEKKKAAERFRQGVRRLKDRRSA